MIYVLTAKELLEKRPVMVDVESQKFFKECSVKEGCTDNGFQPWQKRASPLVGKKTLISKPSAMPDITTTAQMASNWQQIQEDGDRYLLQYRTVGDDRVRYEHQLMDGITLPPSDPFWAEYYPPNGWRCRCTAVQVLKTSYEKTNPNQAMELGKGAINPN